jgi:hypothetical protein
MVGFLLLVESIVERWEVGPAVSDFGIHAG